MNNTGYLALLLCFTSCTLFGPGSKSATSKDQTSSVSTTITSGDQVLQPREKEMLAEINRLRSNPPAYVPQIEDYLRRVENDPSWEESYRQDELQAGRELIVLLQQTPPLSQLAPHPGLYQTALLHSKDIQAQERPTHQGSDGSQPFNRITQQTPALLDGAENLISGAATPTEALIRLLVDANVLDKEHRQNLLHPKWIFATCHEIGTVGKFSGNWIQLFATDSDRENALDTTLLPPVLLPSADYSFMTSDEKAMLEEINLIRANPPGYVAYIEAYIKEFQAAGWDAATTEEEVTTAQELIAELQGLEARPILRPHQPLYQVAQLHGTDLQQMGKVQHQGSDGSMPYHRVRQGTDLSDGNENIVGGTTFIRESVITLLVDSGIPNRGHRRTLLEPKWEYVACYRVGQVGQMPNTWLQVFGAD